MNKKIIPLIFVFIILSIYVYSAFTSIIIDSPENYYNVSTNEVLINASAILSDDDTLTNLSLYINTTGTGQTEWNMSNSTTLYNATTYEFNITLLDGVYNYSVSAEDNSSNVLEAVARILTVDTIYSLIYIDIPRNITYNNETVDFNYTIIEINLDTSLYSNNSGVTNYTLTSNLSQVIWDEGNNQILLYANDSAGNENTTSVTFIVDTIAPTVNLDSPLFYENFSNNIITFNITPSEEKVLSNCSLWGDFDGSFILNYTLDNPTNGTTNNLTSLVLNDGTYLWNVECSDSAGNAVFNETNSTFTVDTTNPVITLINPVDNYESSSNVVTFSYNVSDDTLTNCTTFLDRNGGYEDNLTVISNTTSSNIFYGLNDGIDYKWHVDCSDALSNNASSSERTVKIRFSTSGTTAGGGSFGGSPITAEEPKEEVLVEEVPEKIVDANLKLQQQLLDNVKKNKLIWGLAILSFAIAFPRKGKGIEKKRRWGKTLYLSAALVAYTFLPKTYPYLAKMEEFAVKIGSDYPIATSMRTSGFIIMIITLATLIILLNKHKSRGN